MKAILIAGALALSAGVAANASAQEPLRLGDALERALEYNPSLSARALEVHSLEALADQASAWSNPALSFELENAAGSGEFAGVDNAEVTLALSQLLELGGKRSYRRSAALSARDAAAAERDATRLDVALETTRAFVEVLAAQERVVLADTLVEVAASVLSDVDARVRAGGALHLEAGRARVALETSRIDRDLARRALAAARSRLAAIWGGRADDFGPAEGDLGAIAADIPPLDALAGAVDDTPDVRAPAAFAEAQRARARLERSLRVPDLTLDAGVRRLGDAGETALVFGISAPLPLFDRRGGAARAADLGAESSLQDARAVAVQTTAALARTYASLAGAHAEALQLRDGVLPEAETVASASGEAYRGGRIALTDVLDTQRTLFQLKRRYVDATARYHIAVAEIERLTARPLFEPEVTE